MSTTRIHQGMPVVGRDGNQIGTVKAVNQNHILIDRSWQRDVWAPERAIRNVAGGAVHLDLDENQMGNRNWPSPPLFGPPTDYQGGPGYGTYQGAGYPGYAGSGYYGNQSYGAYGRNDRETGYSSYGSLSGYGSGYGTGDAKQGSYFGGTGYGNDEYGYNRNLNQGYGTYMSGGGYGSYRDQNRSSWMWPNQTDMGGYGSYDNWSAAGTSGFGSYGPSSGTASYTVYGPGSGTGSTGGYGGYGGYGTYGRFGTEQNTSDWNNANWGTNNWANASDQDIENEICQRLTQAGNIDASDVEVAVNQRVVTLSGSVDTRQAKREAGTVADSVPGVEDVNNNLRIDQGLMGRLESTL